MRTIQRNIAGAFIFSNDDHVLLGKNVKGGVYEDLWVVPGGGIDEGESKEEAARRELLEEVGIDITTGSVEEIDFPQTGTTEKTLRDTGERVLVDMTFYNFKVSINAAAKDIPMHLEDDFEHAEWVPLSELKNKNYSPSVEAIFKHLGLI
ncbi:MAG: NUDIX hydrolase [Candidatus Saccharimonadota bacterium]